MKIAIFIFDLESNFSKVLDGLKKNLFFDAERDFFVFREKINRLERNMFSGCRLLVDSEFVINGEKKFNLKHLVLKKHLSQYSDYDYYVCISGKSVLKKKISFSKIEDKKTCAILHPGFITSPRNRYTYETNRESSAYIDRDEGGHYFFDFLVGGDKEEFLKFNDYICKSYELDRSKKIVPIWGEESYLNRYMIDHPPDLILTPDYLETIKNKKDKPSKRKDIINKKYDFDGKINLTDLTFMIPIKIDSLDRLQNLILLLKYLNHHFHTNIIVMEEDNEPHPILSTQLSSWCEYHFIKSRGDFFYRTKLLNMMTKLSKTEFVSNYDCDIFLKPIFYKKSMELLRSRKRDMMYPFLYNIMIPREYYSVIEGTMSLEKIKINPKWVISKTGYGCCNMISKEKYIQCGMENENFLSWGPEDSERYIRFSKFRLRIGRLKESHSFHLEHSRGKDSGIENIYYKHNYEEFNKVSRMKIDELKKYIKTWSWVSEKSEGVGRNIDDHMYRAI